MVVQNLPFSNLIGLMVAWDIFLCNLIIRPNLYQYLHTYNSLVNIFSIIHAPALVLYLSYLIPTQTMTTTDIIIPLLVK